MQSGVASLEIPSHTLILIIIPVDSVFVRHKDLTGHKIKIKLHVLSSVQTHLMKWVGGAGVPIKAHHATWKLYDSNSTVFSSWQKRLPVVSATLSPTLKI